MRARIARTSKPSPKGQTPRKRPGPTTSSAFDFAWLPSTGLDDKTQADVAQTLARIWRSANAQRLHKNVSVPDYVAISVAQQMRVPLSRQATTAFQLQINLLGIEMMIPYSRDVDRRALGRIHTLAKRMHLELCKLKKRDRLFLYECLHRDEYFSPIECFEFETKKELQLGAEPLEWPATCGEIRSQHAHPHHRLSEVSSSGASNRASEGRPR
jgi:hypothetical protein